MLLRERVPTKKVKLKKLFVLKTFNPIFQLRRQENIQGLQNITSPIKDLLLHVLGFYIIS